MHNGLRIAIVAGGNSIHTIRWVNWLKRKGHTVSTFSLKKSESSTYFGPAPRLDRSLILNLGGGIRKTASLLQNLIDDFRPDLVHGFFMTNHGFYASRIRNYPVIVTAMGSDVLVHPERSRLLSGIVRKTAKKAVAVVCPPLLVEKLEEMGVERNKIHSNLIGIDTELFKPLKKEDMVLFSRGFKEVYNPSVVADAIGIVHSKNPAINFCLAGDGPLKEDIESKLKDFNVDFTGQLSEESLAEIMGQSKIVISPSFSDSIPLTAFEAMACGSILIASDIPAHRQWDNMGYPIVFFDPHDSGMLSENILKSWHDENLLGDAITAGPEIVKLNWNWKRQAEEVLKIYDNVIG